MNLSSRDARATRAGIKACCLCGTAVLATLLTAGGAEAAKPTHKTITAGSRSVKLTLAAPTGVALPAPFLVVFASGDGGLRGLSKELLAHLAEQHYWVVGFSSPQAFKDLDDDAKGQPNYSVATDRFASIVAQAKAALGIPTDTPIVISGMSRGANVVVAAAGSASLRAGITGAVAIALTRELDDVTLPKDLIGSPGIQTDDRGRLQTYPSLERLGALRVAVIQSTNDSYVKSAESRRLLGPDTPTRRLYEIDSKNHNFGGGREALMHALDDAMMWVAR
jgi:hypothetical protein